MKHVKTAMLMAFAMVLASAAFLVADTSDAASDYTARVFVDDGGIEPREYEGTGPDVKSIISDAFSDNGKSIDFRPNGTIMTVNGQEASEGREWVIFQWLPPQSWKVALPTTMDAYLVDGTSYYVYESETTKEGNKTVYTPPEFEPMATAYFFIAMQEDFNKQISLDMTEKELRRGFWIDGTGCDLAEAFHDACARYGLALEMNLTEGNEMKGWLGDFMGLKDERGSGGDSSTWKYWSQYYWDGADWRYSQCMGHYDPGVTKYFGIMRQVSELEEPSIGTDVSPVDIPISNILNGSKVRYYCDGQLVKEETVKYFGEAQPPEIGNVPVPEGNVFTGWDVEGSGLKYVLRDQTVNAVYSDEALVITNKDSVKTLNIGDEAQLEIQVNGKAPTHVIYTSSDNSIAEVDANGRITAKANGSVTITAAEFELSDSFTLKVVTPVESVSIDNKTSQMIKGTTHVLTFTLNPATTSDIPNFTTDAPNIVHVDSNGKMTANGVGEATISLNCGDKSDSFKVTVVEKTMRITGAVDVLKVGSTHTIGVEFTPEGYTEPVTFTSGNPSVATVDADGRITGVANGTVVITVAGDGISDRITIDVYTPVESVSIDNKTSQMLRGDSLQVSYTVKPATSSSPVTFASDAPEIVSVDAGGRITALSKGSATITVACGDKSDSFRVEVIALETVVIRNGVTEMTVGDELVLEVVITPVGFTKPVTFASSDTSVATVDGTGRVVAIGQGTVTINVTCDDKTVGMIMEVKPKAVDSGDRDITIEVDGGRVNVTIGNQGSEIPADKVEAAIDKAENEQGDIVVTIPSSEGKVVFEKESMELLASKDATIVVTGDGVIATYPAGIVSNLSSGKVEFDVSVGTGGLTEAQMNASGDRTVIQLTVKVDGADKSELGGTSVISMEYTLGAGQTADNVTVFHVDIDGTKTAMPTTYDGTRITFETDHHSAFMIGEREQPQGGGSGSGDNGSEGGDNTMIIIGAVIAIVIIAAIAVFYLKTRNA